MKGLWRTRFTQFVKHRSRTKAKILSASNTTSFIELPATNEIVGIAADICKEKTWLFYLINDKIKILF